MSLELRGHLTTAPSSAAARAAPSSAPATARARVQTEPNESENVQLRQISRQGTASNRTPDVAAALEPLHSAERGGADARSLNGQVTSPEDAEPEDAEPGLDGWLVVAASCVCFFVTLGLVYSWGVTQNTLVQRGFASSSVLGWVSSMSVIYLSLLAVPLQSAVLKFGNRAVAFVGALTAGAGYIATSFSFDPKRGLAPIFISQSVFGVGYAMIFWASNSLAAQWFPPRKVGLAVGIVFAGSGVGGAIASIALNRMVASIGLELSIRIYGIIALLTLVPASYFLRRKTTQKLTIHWSVTRDRKFAFLFAATVLVFFCLFVPPFFLPMYATSAGFSAEVGAWLVAGYNLSSAVGRVLFGVIADGRLGPVTTLTLCFFLFGATILAIWTAAAGALAPLIIFMLLNGAAGGAVMSLQPAVGAAIWQGSGRGEMQSVLAMSTMGRIFGSLLGAPIAGYLLDAFGGAGFGTGAYRPALLVMGFISMLAFAFLYSLRWSVGGFDLKKRV